MAFENPFIQGAHLQMETITFPSFFLWLRFLNETKSYFFRMK